MTESERDALRRQWDSSMHDFATRNAAAIAALSGDMKELSEALHKTNERLMQIESNQTQISSDAIAKAQKATFAKFGVDIDDPKQLQAFQQNLLFGASVHKGVNKMILIIVLAALGAIGTAVGASVSGWFRL